MKVLVVFSAVVATTLAAALINTTAPIYTTGCRRSDPDFNECLGKAIYKILKEGIKEIDFKPLDQYYVPEVHATLKTISFHFKGVMRDTTAYGLSKVQISNMFTDCADPQNIKVSVDFFLPSLVGKGSYKLDGPLGDFQIRGKGAYNISLSDVSGPIKVNGHLTTIDGKQYLKIHRVILRPEVRGMKLYLENLVRGNPQLSQTALAFVNQFWPLVYSELQPFIEQALDKLIRHTINQVTMKIPFDDLVPE